jgi:hypothetical protein
MLLPPGCLAPSAPPLVSFIIVLDHICCNDIRPDVYQRPPEKSARFRVYWRRWPFLIVAGARFIAAKSAGIWTPTDTKLSVIRMLFS